VAGIAYLPPKHFRKDISERLSLGRLSQVLRHCVPNRLLQFEKFEPDLLLFEEQRFSSLTQNRVDGRLHRRRLWRVRRPIGS